MNKRFQVVFRIHPGRPWLKTLSESSIH